MIVYKITNTVNNKIYVGATIRTLEERWKEHLKYSRNDTPQSHLPLYIDMRLFGEDKFSISVLKECVSYEELYDTETYYINKFNSVEDGYNTYHCSPTRDDWDEFYRHLRNSMTDDVKHRISDSLKAHIEQNGISDIHRERLSTSAIGNTNGINNKSHSIGCYCIDPQLGRIDFRNIKDAGVWWYETYSPFGEVYSQATYQRKILDCINTGSCKYQRKDKTYIYIDTSIIQWFRK